MKRILILLVSSILCLESYAQIKTKNDTFYLRNDSTASYRLDVKNNDSSGSKLYIFYFFKTGANANQYKIERSPDSSVIILTDTVSISYSGTFKYYIKNLLGNTDSAEVFFSKIALAPEVRPGETNLDNLVNHFDLFSIGLNYGKTGSPRHSVDTNIIFTPKRVGNWFYQPGGINSKHADIDGNGKIETLDLEKLKLNFGAVSGTYTPRLSPPSTITSLEIDAKDTIEVSGDTLKLALRVNSSTKQVAYGLGFTLSVENQNKVTQVDSFYPNYKFKQSIIWPTSIQPNLFISDEITKPNHKNIAYARTNQSNDSIIGGPGIVEIVVTEILIGRYDTEKARIKINLKDVALIDNNYNTLPISPVSKTIYIKKSKASLSNLNSRQVEIYPTLIDHLLMIEKNTSKNEAYSIYNSIGQRIQSGVLSNHRTILEDIQWTTGIYYLKLENSPETIKLQKK